MNCKKCGNEIKEGENFCSKCGKAVNEKEKIKFDEEYSSPLYASKISLFEGDDDLVEEA